MRSETTRCGYCGESIYWNNRILEDGDFNGVIDKLKYHHKNSMKCKREKLLKELLDEKSDRLNN